jgi:hypothetical protein
MDSDAADGPRAAGDDATDGADPTLVDRWLALDRGWQALALGLGIVAVHVAGQLAGVL